MNNFNDGAPRNPKQWIDLGRNLVPLSNGTPIIPEWQKKTLKLSDFKGVFQYGLRLDEDTDFDIDNHFIKRFVEKYLKNCGAKFGRKSNPSSHYLFSGSREYKIFTVPKELEPQFKHFEHGCTLGEIRSGQGKFTIVPDSISKRSKTEYVEWENFSGIKEYNGDLEADIGKIALSGALSIIYPPEGSRDSYCTAIAGVLSKHTNWNEDEINEFVYNLAVLSGDHEPNKRMAKGTTSKEKTFGMPKLAEIINCSVKTISELFSWVGVADSGSCFTALRCYTTEPKYWQLEYKGKWITVMATSELSAYPKISNLIMENCYEVAPAITAKDWRVILAGLLQNVQKIDTPYESSYYGSIGVEFIIHMEQSVSSERWDLGSHFAGVWLNPEDKHYYFRLENFIRRLKQKQMSFEMRKMTHFLREDFECLPCKITFNKKEIRVWKVPAKTIKEHELNNTDAKAFKKLAKEHFERREKARADGDLPF